MTPLTPEAVAQMVADRDAGTPGPWVADDNEGYSPRGVWQGCTPTGNGKAGRLIARIVGDDAQAGFDAARVERLPDLEAAYLTLAAENATLRAERDELTAAIDSIETSEGLTSNGNLWRFWANRAREMAPKIDALRASEAAAQGMVLVLTDWLSELGADMNAEEISRRLAALTPTTNGETP